MASLRKRRHDDQHETFQVSSQLPPLLERLRNMWQFSNLCQWLAIFGGVVKLDYPDIDELEIQCITPQSTVLQDIGLALLKYLSSHRGLTHDLFDEFTRRQYAAKAPHLPNPFGSGAIPVKFSSFTVFQRICILHQMTLFIMMNPEKLREKMADQKDADRDQTTWRIEPFGWDRSDRIYFVLDDNRVYRLTEAATPPARPKKNTYKARARTRHESKRRRVSSAALDKAINDAEDDSEITSVEQTQAAFTDTDVDNDNGLGGMKWECIAVSLDELRALLSSISSKKDPNERVLHDKIVQHLLPILEQQDERRKKREKEREKELFNMARMASAKRSSRIAGRQEQQRQRATVLEEEQKRLLDHKAQRQEEQTQRKVDKEREARQLTRERRLLEREIRRAQHEDELNRLSEGGKSPDRAAGRMSERMRQAAIEKNKAALRELAEEGEEEEWIFDCVCGLRGKVDDGQHSVSCENCNTWQHSKCLGIDEHDAEEDEFHFICELCKQRASAAPNGHANGRPVIRIKFNKPAAELAAEAGDGSADESALATPFDQPFSNTGIARAPLMNATAPETVRLPLSESFPVTQASGYTHSSVAGQLSVAPPVLGLPASSCNVSNIPVKTNDSTALPVSASSGKQSPVPDPVHHGYVTNLFALPRPDLPQPDQSPRRSHAYGTIQGQATSNLGDNAHFGPPTPTAATPAGNRPATSFQLSHCSFATPQLHRPQDGRGENKVEASSSPLPSHGGESPIKQSPAGANDQASVVHGTRLTPSVLPPITALSPSTPVEVLALPVKPEGMPHGKTLSGMPLNIVSQPRGSESRIND